MIDKGVGDALVSQKRGAHHMGTALDQKIV
jgi:hypothetical protein